MEIISKCKEIRKSRIGVLIFGMFVLLNHVQAQAPKPPLPAEIFFGNEQLYFQLVVKKSFTPESRLGFFTVATYSALYADLSDVNITLPAHLYYNFWKGFSAVGGAAINSVVGFSPYAGFQHNYASRKVLAVTVASFYLNADNDFKVFGLYEYKPPINETWSFYSRLQFIYNTSLKEGSHNRSYLYLRAGLKRKSFIFGLGANLDQYGPFKDFEDNYGVFVRWEFR